MSKTTLHSFTPLQRLGQGTFSSVYKVRRISDGKIYALKKIKIASLKQKQKQNALNQIRILASISSPHIVTYKQAFFDQNLKLLCIVMELANNGDLYQKITNQKQTHSLIPEPQIWKIFYHVAQGLDILHQNRVLHRDLKSANIFVNSGVYKIGDLNVSKVVSHQKLVRTQTGTPYYASPQVWRDEPYGQKSDIWSLGCIIYEACTFSPPFLGDSLDELFKNVQKGRFKPISSHYSSDLHQMIAKCLDLRSNNRPSTSQLLNPQGILTTKCKFYEIQLSDQIKNTKQAQPFLSTIKMPYDIKHLNNKLPHSQYDNPSPCIKKQQQQTQKYRQNPRESNYRQNISKRQGTISQNYEQNKLSKGTGQPISSSLHQKNVKQSLPQRIKQHLSHVVHKQAHQKYVNRRPKYRVQTSIGSRQRPMLKSVDKVQQLRPDTTQHKKQRPLSCNIRNKPVVKATSSRPISSIQPNRMKRNIRSIIEGNCESSLIDHRYNRIEPYYVRPLQQKRIENDRCRSAQYRRPINSSYQQLKKRFESRQRQLNNSLPPQYKQKLLKKQRQLPIITKDVYLRNKKDEKQEIQNKNYLQQIQNKIINSNNHKTKKCIITQPHSNIDSSKVKGMYQRYHLL